MAYQGLGYEIASVMQQALATGLFVSLCSAYEPTGGSATPTLGPSGAPLGTYTPVAGLQSIPCMDAPSSVARVTATEQKSEKQVLSTNSDHILLGGFYPQFPTGEESGWQVWVTDSKGDLFKFDLLGAESDSQATQTRLNVRIAAV